MGTVVEFLLALVFGHFKVLHSAQGSTSGIGRGKNSVFRFSCSMFSSVVSDIGAHFPIIEPLESLDSGIGESFARARSVGGEWGHWRLFSLNCRIQLMLNEVLPVFHRARLGDFPISHWSVRWML